MIGSGNQLVGQMAALYLAEKRELQDKSDGELEGLVKTLNPKVKMENAVFGGLLTTFVSSLIGVGIASTIPEIKDNAHLGFQYLGAPAMLALGVYMFTYGFGKGMEIRYKRDAAQQILDERRQLEVNN